MLRNCSSYFHDCRRQLKLKVVIKEFNCLNVFCRVVVTYSQDILSKVNFLRYFKTPLSNKGNLPF